MELYNLTTKIFYVLAVLTALTIVLYVSIGGLTNLDYQLETFNTDTYRRAAILEKVLSLEANSSQLRDTSYFYRYDHRRSVIPVEYFTNKDNDNGMEIGYKKRNNHCYIDQVEGLDGKNFGVFILPKEPIPSTSVYRQLNCTSTKGQPNKRVFSSALMVRKAYNNTYLPARIYVYEIN